LLFAENIQKKQDLNGKKDKKNVDCCVQKNKTRAKYFYTLGFSNFIFYFCCLKSLIFSRLFFEKTGVK
jgi:hypothetical protein